MTIHHGSENWPALWQTAQQMLAVDPLRQSLHVHLARAAEELGKTGAAIAACRALIRLDPIDPAQVHFRLARLLQQTGDLPAARRQVLMALEEAPRFRAAQRTLLEIIAEMDGGKGPEDPGGPPPAKTPGVQ
jgi:tetratricopeptide (TPR) repeat protein